MIMHFHGPAELIAEILRQRVFAVAGASRDREKFGYQVYQTLKQNGYTAYAVNPNAESIDGDPVYPLLDNVPEQIDCVVTVVQPAVTFDVIHNAGHLKIPFAWMQPGSESEPAVKEAIALGMQAVYGGPCIMVEISRRKSLPE